jgi:hypothetical protein
MLEPYLVQVHEVCIELIRIWFLNKILKICFHGQEVQDVGGG